MTAEGKIYTVLMFGKNYFYLPTQETWTLDIKKISLGDIYFSNKLVQIRMGSPKDPDMNDWPQLPNPDERKISITLHD